MMEIKEITVTDAKKYLEEGTACFIDVRDAGSYLSSHIEGALSLNDDNIEDFLNSADKSKVHIIYCYHGHSSMGATGYFNEKGFKEVYSMTGGYTEWASRIN
jgi:thiosulfate sulfurtransferase